MAPLLEMFFECFFTPVAGTSTYFTLKLLIEPMQLVEPVRYGLAIPADWQVLWVVLNAVLVVITFLGENFLNLLLIGKSRPLFILISKNLLITLAALFPHLILGSFYLLF